MIPELKQTEIIRMDEGAKSTGCLRSSMASVVSWLLCLENAEARKLLGAKIKSSTICRNQ